VATAEVDFSQPINGRSSSIGTGGISVVHARSWQVFANLSESEPGQPSFR
jgi:hypothetical protein